MEVGSSSLCTDVASMQEQLAVRQAQVLEQQALIATLLVHRQGAYRAALDSLNFERVEDDEEEPRFGVGSELQRRLAIARLRAERQPSPSVASGSHHFVGGPPGQSEVVQASIGTAACNQRSDFGISKFDVEAKPGTMSARSAFGGKVEAEEFSSGNNVGAEAFVGDTDPGLQGDALDSTSLLVGSNGGAMASVGDTDLCLQSDAQDSTSLLVAEDGADGAINGAEVIGFLAVGSNVGNGLQISDEGGAVDWDVLFPTAGLFKDVEAGSSGDNRRKVEGHFQPKSDGEQSSESALLEAEDHGMLRDELDFDQSLLQDLEALDAENCQTLQHGTLEAENFHGSPGFDNHAVAMSASVLSESARFQAARAQALANLDPDLDAIGHPCGSCTVGTSLGRRQVQHGVGNLADQSSADRYGGSADDFNEVCDRAVGSNTYGGLTNQIENYNEVCDRDVVCHKDCCTISGNGGNLGSSVQGSGNPVFPDEPEPAACSAEDGGLAVAHAYTAEWHELENIRAKNDFYEAKLEGLGSLISSSFDRHGVDCAELEAKTYHSSLDQERKAMMLADCQSMQNRTSSNLQQKIEIQDGVIRTLQNTYACAEGVIGSSQQFRTSLEEVNAQLEAGIVALKKLLQALQSENEALKGELAALQPLQCKRHRAKGTRDGA